MCSRSILAVQLHMDAYGTAPKMCCACSKLFSSIIRMWHPCVFGKHSRSIQHVRKTFGKHACIRNEILEVLGSVCFPNTPNGPRT